MSGVHRLNGHALAIGTVVSADSSLEEILKSVNAEVRKYSAAPHMFSYEIETWILGRAAYEEEYECEISQAEYRYCGIRLLESAVDWLKRSCPDGVTFGITDGDWGFWPSPES